MKHLLNQAKQEILMLRRQNEILSAQVGVIEVFAAACGLSRGSGAMAPDVVFQLQKKIDELDAQPTADPAS